MGRHVWMRSQPASASAMLLPPLLLLALATHTASVTPLPSSKTARMVPTVRLANGIAMPAVAAGTWEYSVADAERAVAAAVAAGFTHIDTANNYNNQVGVGAGLVASGVPREQLFVTSKIPGCGLGNISLDAESCAADSRRAIREDLEQIDTPYLDLLLVHFPPAGGCGEANCRRIQHQWAAVEEAYVAKKLRAIGVSNFCVSCLECLRATMRVAPMVNQVKYHVGMGVNPRGLQSYCTSRGVVMQAYSPLGDKDASLFDKPLLKTVGDAHGKSSVQVALKWVWQRGVPLVTKSLNPAHLAQDLDLFEWELSPQEMTALDAEATPKGEPSFMCTS